MSGTTAHGWPYVLAGDYPKAYPAVSLDLANKLEVVAGDVAVGTLTFYDSWSDMGGSYGALQVLRYGNGVAMVVGAFKHAGKVLAAQTYYQIGQLPTGFRPPAQIMCAGVITASGVNAPCRADVTPAGSISIYSPSAFTATLFSIAGVSWKVA